MASFGPGPSMENTPKTKREPIRPANKRAKSASPPKVKPMNFSRADNVKCSQSSVSTPEYNKLKRSFEKKKAVSEEKLHHTNEKGMTLPLGVKQKMQKLLAIKKLTFNKLKKTLFSNQIVFLELYSGIKDIENHIGTQNDAALGDIRIVSMEGWPSHDLLMLVHECGSIPSVDADVKGVFGATIFQQLQDLLSSLPDELFRLSSEVLAKRIEVISLLKYKVKPDRATFSYQQSIEWKSKLTEMDKESENLKEQIAKAAEDMVMKIKRVADLAKKPWYDRENLVKKIEKLERENAILQNKLDEEAVNKKATGDEVQSRLPSAKEQAASSEIQKDRHKEQNSLKDIVRTAEELLRVSRAKIATMERQQKELRTELENSQKKAKDFEQIVTMQKRKTDKNIRLKEANYEVRTKKLVEASKTGEMTIMVLTRQRDALELRVKELQDQLETVERSAENKVNEEKSRADSLLDKALEQEKARINAESKVIVLELKVEDLEDKLKLVKEKSLKLVQINKEVCLDYTPAKEHEPSDHETELWKELEGTKILLKQAEDELQRSRQDKESFLNSLSRLSQGETDGKLKDKMTTELLQREQKIAKMQKIIEELLEREKMMEASMMNYENQISDLKMEVRSLRMYDCFAKDIPYENLQLEILDLHQKVQSLSKERSSLISAAAARALMLERHERSADLYARITRWRRELEAVLSGRAELSDDVTLKRAQMSRSLTSIIKSGAETWSALRAERARVLNLERRLLSQSSLLDREERVRTQLERKCTYYERQLDLQSRLALKTSLKDGTL